MGCVAGPYAGAEALRALADFGISGGTRQGDRRNGRRARRDGGRIFHQRQADVLEGWDNRDAHGEVGGLYRLFLARAIHYEELDPGVAFDRRWSSSGTS